MTCGLTSLSWSYIIHIKSYDKYITVTKFPVINIGNWSFTNSIRPAIREAAIFESLTCKVEILKVYIDLLLWHWLNSTNHYISIFNSLVFKLIYKVILEKHITPESQQAGYYYITTRFRFLQLCIVKTPCLIKIVIISLSVLKIYFFSHNRNHLN